MANLDDANAPGGNGTPASDGGAPARDALERRVRELERENAALRKEFADLSEKHRADKEILMALLLEDMPRTEEEFREMLAHSHSFSDTLRELGVVP